MALVGTDVDELDGFGDGVPETVLVTGAVGDEGVENELLDVVGYIALYLGCITAVCQALWVYPCSMRLGVCGGRGAVRGIFG